MSYTNLQPCLPGEGRYLRPKECCHTQYPGHLPSQRWVRYAQPMEIKTDIEEVVHLLPAHQRKAVESHRH